MNIKRIIAVVLALLTLGLALPFVGVGAEGDSFTVVVTANKDTVSCENTVTFTVMVKDIKAEGGLLSVDVPFRFDTGVFDFVGKAAIFPNEWAEPADFSYASPKNGLLWLRSLDQSGNFTDNGCDRDGAIGFRVTLKAKKNAVLGDTTVSVNGDGVFEVISGTASDGVCTEVGGKGDPLTVKVTAFDVLLGDINDDGYVDNLDAANILKYDAGITNLSAEKVAQGDMNGDGALDNLDATIILKIDAGLA